MIAPIEGELFISNIDGSRCAAEIWRRLRIDESRDRVRELRYKHPFQAFAIMMHTHHFRHVDPVLDRAYQWHMYLGLHEPQLTTRETWRMAWHNARCYLNHTRTDHD